MDARPIGVEPLIRVLLVDDHLSFSDALTVVLNLQGDMTVVGSANSGSLAVQLATQHQPDVILMDYHLPDVNGAIATAQIKRLLPRTKVVMLTAAAVDDVLLACIEAGASGYLQKEQAVAAVADTIRRAHDGDILVPRTTLLRLLNRLHDRGETRPGGIDGSRLTAREHHVLQELATGSDDATISGRMGISPLTFRTHVRNIMSKLGVHSRLEAVTFGIRAGFIKI